MRQRSAAWAMTAVLMAALLATTCGVEAVAVTSRAAAGPTVLGSTAAAPDISCTNATVVQLVSGPGTPGYVVPAGGVITSFSARADASAGDQVRMVLFGPPTNRTYPVRAKTTLRALVPSTLNTFEVRVPVETGWVLGASFQGSGVGCGAMTSSADQMGAATTFDDPTTATFASVANALIDISAVVEPDADHDGFGDLTQDACPTSALAQAACPAPETTITKAPGAKTKKRRVSVAFSSTVPGSLFIVTVDGKAAGTIPSPFTRKLGYGHHTVTVQAVSPLGPVDPVPATVSFKIKKKRSH
jgi:hypothetical protein